MYSGVSTAISLLVRLISNKIIAVYLGTNGIFLLGQLKDFLRLSNVFSGFGIENGIIKYTSEFQKSEGELRKALKAKINSNDIVFSGVGKTEEEIAFAIQNNCFQINIESLSEIKRVNDIAEKITAKDKSSLLKIAKTSMQTKLVR